MRAHQQGPWNRQAERARRAEVHDQLEFGRQFDRKVSRARAAQNFVDVPGHSAVVRSHVRSVAHEVTGFGELGPAGDRRDSARLREARDVRGLVVDQVVWDRDDCPGFVAFDCRECRLEVVPATDRDPLQL